MSRWSRRNAIPLAFALALAPPAFAQHAGHAGHAKHAAPVRTPTCSAEHAAMGHCTMPVASQREEGAPSGCTPAHAAMDHCTMPATAPDTDTDTDTDACTPEHAAMGHCTLPATTKQDDGKPSACSPEHAAMGHCTPEATPTADDCPPEHAAMGHCTPASDALQAPREAIPPVTEADRAAAFSALRHEGMSHGPATYGRVVFNRLEAWDAEHGTGQAWEGSASYGGDVQRLWLRSEGEREGGRTGSSDLEVLYGRGITPWWDVVAGVKHDFRPASSQSWAAFGVQGMAPHFFEISATAYVGESGRVAAAFEVEYEMLLTNRLVLQPLLEVELNSKDDPQRHVGSGLSKAEAGLRLRYEFTRRFAPYVGVAHERTFGRTADYHAAEGDDTRETRVVAGVRVWF